jgi:pentatricopeptide repeat protein
MICGFVKFGDGYTALEFFKEMQQHGLLPDMVSFSCAFCACRSRETLDQGKSDA